MNCNIDDKRTTKRGVGNNRWLKLCVECRLVHDLYSYNRDVRYVSPAVPVYLTHLWTDQPDRDYHDMIILSKHILLPGNVDKFIDLSLTCDMIQKVSKKICEISLRIHLRDLALFLLMFMYL